MQNYGKNGYGLGGGGMRNEPRTQKPEWQLRPIRVCLLDLKWHSVDEIWNQTTMIQKSQIPEMVESLRKDSNGGWNVQSRERNGVREYRFVVPGVKQGD